MKETLTNKELQEASTIFKILGNPTRIKILYFLKNQESNVTGIVKHLAMDQPAVSQHLVTLYRYRLINRRQVGKNVYYTLNDTHILEIISEMLDHIKYELHEEPCPLKIQKNNQKS